MRSLVIFLFASSFVACTPKDETTDTADTDMADADTDTDTDTDTDSDTDTDTDTDTDVPTECVEEGGACILTGVYTDDLYLTADKPWLLRSLVQIGDDTSNTTIKIQAGTTVYGESATNGLLVIARGAKINAEGTASSPIVFTSDQAVGSRARGDWGGIAINGRGIINACAEGTELCEATGEGGTGTYGGNDNTDNSGILKYVVIQFGGTEISTDNEVNGLGLQGVGSGTVIDFVQIHRNLDDGIEFFGGAPNVRHLVVSDAGDDNIDWTLGYQGNIQFALVVQASDAGNHGFELDNNEDDYSALPLTGGIVSNVTLIGSSAIDEDNFALLARRGTSGQFWNVAATGFSAGCLAIRNEETYANFVGGDGAIAYSALACASNFEAEAAGSEDVGGTEDGVFAAGTGNIEVSDLMLGANHAPTASSPLLGAGVVPSGSFFTAANYIGAFDGTTDWTSGWTEYPAN